MQRTFEFDQCAMRDSDPRPVGCGPTALPTELIAPPTEALLYRKVGCEFPAPIERAYLQSLNLPDRFWAKISLLPGPCWVWEAGKTGQGYGRFSYRGRLWLPHRLMMVLIHGEQACDGLDTLHGCDNPRCCRPSHLSIGTRSENMKDCVRRGRFTCNWNAKRRKTAGVETAREFATAQG